MNLVETIKNIGRDIKELFKRTDAIEKRLKTQTQLQLVALT